MPLARARNDGIFSSPIYLHQRRLQLINKFKFRLFFLFILEMTEVILIFKIVIIHFRRSLLALSFVSPVLIEGSETFLFHVSKSSLLHKSAIRVCL